MKEIYIVEQSLGSYSDYNVVPILATFSEEIANNKIKEMYERQERAKECSDSLNMQMDEWQKQNPPPELNTRSHSKGRLTKKIDEDPAWNDYADWAKARWKKLEEVKSTFTAQEQEDIHGTSGCDWNLTTIPFAE